jgi:hypothetical protein
MFRAEPSSGRRAGDYDAGVRRSTLGFTFAVALLALAGLGAGASVASAFTGFVSPSHNIGCVISSQSVRCDIRVHSWQSPPKPKSCELDYGGGVAVDKSGRAQFLCAGDTTLEAGPVLGYGDSVSRGRFRCTSQESGMRCVNKRSGHGFFLAKQSYRLF